MMDLREQLLAWFQILLILVYFANIVFDFEVSSTV